MEQLADVTVTTATKEDADALARQVVDERLADCGNIVGIHSIYRWKETVENEPVTLISIW